MEMYVGEAWIDKGDKIEVTSPYDGRVIDTVPRADERDVELALQTAVRGAAVMRELTAYERSEILYRLAQLIQRDAEDLARTISSEEGKPLSESRVEVTRAAEIVRLSAEEAKRLFGEVIPLDAAPGVRGKMGFTVRVPCGVVVAISPFNFPLHLVVHKLGPALAGGNAVIVKPATDTPLSALKVVKLALEAGVPPAAVQCITGSGGAIGEALCRDRRVRKITFTGSRAVGEAIMKVAGLKRVTMELGSNSPLIVMEDADLERVAELAAMTGFSNAGQVCISTQRIFAAKSVHDEFVERLAAKAAAIRVGDPLAEGTGMGPMVRESDAVRVVEWIQEAVQKGARLIAGGERQGAMVTPAVLADVAPDARLMRDELFGPAVAVRAFSDIDEAIAMANDTQYGLSAGIFTRNIDWAMKFAQRVEAGNIHINWGPQWRADLMPYGGLKESGFGKEGPRYAVQEMTETKMVVFHL